MCRFFHRHCRNWLLHIYASTWHGLDAQSAISIIPAQSALQSSSNQVQVPGGDRRMLEPISMAVMVIASHRYLQLQLIYSCCMAIGKTPATSPPFVSSKKSEVQISNGKASQMIEYLTAALSRTFLRSSKMESPTFHLHTA